MCSTWSTSTANWITDRQLRSVCTTTLAMLRWTNTSPGERSTTWFAGTRESEQPIHRYFGACCFDRRSKKPGSSRETRSAQARLLSSRSSSRFIGYPRSERDADIARLGEEAHGLESAFAPKAGGTAAAEWRAQV